MKAVSHHALIGACVAAALMLGASVASNGGAAQSSMNIGQLTTFRQEAVAQFAATVHSCRDVVLDVAFDAYGDIAARLKQS
jgi:hypothetical protein